MKNEPRAGGPNRTVARVPLAMACAVCCAGPMLVLVGVISTGAFIAGGVVAASVAAVVAMSIASATRQLPRVGDPVRLATFALGGSAAFAGLWGAAEERPQAYLVITAGVAALTTAALLALGSAHTAGPVRQNDDRALVTKRTNRLRKESLGEEAEAR